jgi:formyl-CoA transferase
MLEGTRVVELGTVITAPLAGMMLADLGADVIKVERPEGDSFRHARGKGYSPNFVAYNRNKRSVVLDLTDAEGRKHLLRLIEESDVLLDNFRPGVLGRLGLDPQSLQTLNPRLIQCSITGFGEAGPYRRRPAYDAVAQALSGIGSLFVDPAKPESVGPTISDNVTGMYACYAILAALYDRTRTGHGRRLEVNMLEASMAFIPDAFSNLTQGGLLSDRYTRIASSQSFALQCADEKLIAIHLSTQDKFWTGLIVAVDCNDLANDGRFSDRENRVAHYRELQDTLRERFLMRQREDWERRLAAADVPFAPIYSLDEALADPQVAALKTVYTTTHPAHGALTGIHCPVLADGRRAGRTGAAPALGEHTNEVLQRLSSGY